MSRPVSYCGDIRQTHAARRCLECKRIQQALHRGKTLEEAKASSLAKQPVCRSCRMRYAVKPPPIRDTYGPIKLLPNQIRWLENAARVFVADSDPEDCWTAEDFIAWLKPDVLGMGVVIPESVGKASQAGGNSPRINSPDPIPYAPLPPKIRGAA